MVLHGPLILAEGKVAVAQLCKKTAIACAGTASGMPIAVGTDARGGGAVGVTSISRARIR